MARQSVVVRKPGSAVLPAAITPTGIGISVLAGTATGTSGPGLPDLTQLPNSLTGNGPDTTAYDALNIPSQSSGYTFNDPVTGVLCCKLTDGSTPDAANHVPWYSTFGLQISQRWGAGLDQYTIAFSASGGTKLLDYKLGGTVSNFRSLAYGEGLLAFSRQSGSEQILYGWASNLLHRYDTSTDSVDDTGDFPYTWNSLKNPQGWLQFNAAETWAVARHSTTTTVTALDLSTGSVITQAGLTGLDEIYSGYNNVAFVNRGAANSQLWHLDTDTLDSPLTMPGNVGPAHVPAMIGHWIMSDTITGGGAVRFRRVDESGTFSSEFNPGFYYGQFHHCGHGWGGQSAGADQVWMMSNFDTPASAPGDANAQYANVFINSQDGSIALLGHHYSDGTVANYWAQPHTTLSHDYRLAVYGSEMRNGGRIDLFVQEVPRAS